MKKCPYCDQEIQDDENICWHCGAPQIQQEIIRSQKNENTGESLSGTAVKSISDKPLEKINRFEQKKRMPLFNVGFIWGGAIASAIAAASFSRSSQYSNFSYFMADYVGHFITNWLIYGILTAAFTALFRRESRSIGVIILGIIVCLFGGLYFFNIYMQNKSIYDQAIGFADPTVESNFSKPKAIILPTVTRKPVQIQSTKSIIPTPTPDCFPWEDIDAKLSGSYICAYSEKAKFFYQEQTFSDYDPKLDGNTITTYASYYLNLPGNAISNYQPLSLLIGNNDFSGYSGIQITRYQCLRFWGWLQDAIESTPIASLPGSFGPRNSDPNPLFRVDKLAPCE